MQLKDGVPWTFGPSYRKRQDNKYKYKKFARHVSRSIWASPGHRSSKTNEATRVHYIRMLYGTEGYAGDSTSPDTQKFAKCIMGDEEDDAGHILASKSGGPGDDRQNMFPQNFSINRGIWAQIESWLRDLGGKFPGKEMELEIVFKYDDHKEKLATRPYAFFIRFGGELPCSGVTEYSNPCFVRNPTVKQAKYPSLSPCNRVVTNCLAAIEDFEELVDADCL